MAGCRLGWGNVRGIRLNPKTPGKDIVLIKRGNGYTLQAADFSYTEFIKDEDQSLITRMLYDHRTDVDENVNVAEKAAYSETVMQLSTILRKQFRENRK